MKFFKTRDVKSPKRATSVAAGIDFFIPNDFVARNIAPGTGIKIPAGIKVKLPSGLALIAQEKSGVATNKQLIVGAKVVDEDYQGEVHIHVINTSSKPVRVSPGEALVQFVLFHVSYSMPVEVTSEDELFSGEVSERGEAGFGEMTKKM